jgi:hypothetical protein
MPGMKSQGSQRSPMLYGMHQYGNRMPGVTDMFFNEGAIGCA